VLPRFRDLLLLLYEMPVHFLFLSKEQSVSLKHRNTSASRIFSQGGAIYLYEKMTRKLQR
jgi:hypothetical protein